MATLPELARFDAGQMIQYGQAGKKQRTLAELGGLAAQGDFRGAQAAAFAGGETEMGLALKGMNDEDQRRLVGEAASWAYQANNPQAWEQGRQAWIARGFDPGEFGQRETLLSQALSVQDRMQESYRQAQLGMDRERLALERQKAAQTGSEGFFGTPIPMEGPEGQFGIGILSKTGNLHLAPNPQGFTPLDPYGKSFQAAQGKVEGEAQGDATTGLSGAVTKAQQGIDVIDQMLSHPGRETATGLSSWIDPRNYIAGTDATDFNVMRRQLEGKAFLEAFESLKGGGHITEIEGVKATQAIARLDTAQSDQAYREALLELRGIMAQGMERARQRAGPGGVMQPPANLVPPSGQSGDGWMDLGNGIRIREVR
jgi:hypothetical protein